MVPFIMGDDAWAKLPNVKRLVDEVSARPAAARADRAQGQVHTFKAEMDDEGAREYSPATSRPRLRPDCE